MNESCHAYERVMSHIRMSHDTHELWLDALTLSPLTTCTCVAASHDTRTSWHPYFVAINCSFSDDYVTRIQRRSCCVRVWERERESECYCIWNVKSIKSQESCDSKKDVIPRKKSIWINKSSVNPKSTSNQSRKLCTVLQSGGDS